MTVLETKDLKKYYGRGDTLVKALDGVSLRVGGRGVRGDRGYVGLRKIHPAPYAGRAGPAGQRLRHRGRKGNLFPEGRGPDHLPPPENRLRVPELQSGAGADGPTKSIVLPIQLDGGRVDKAYVKEVISTLGLAKKLDNLPSQLSGGQQQAGGHRPGPGLQTRYPAG